MKFIKEGEEVIVIDFDKRTISGRTTKKNFHNQIKAVKGVVEDGYI